MTTRATFAVSFYFHGDAIIVKEAAQVVVHANGDRYGGTLVGVTKRGPDAEIRLDVDGAEHSFLASEVEAIAVNGVVHRDRNRPSVSA